MLYLDVSRIRNFILLETMNSAYQCQSLPFPDKLHFADTDKRDRSATWALFRQIWENYEESSQLVDQPKVRRTATRLTCFSPSALKVYNSLSFEEESHKHDIDIVIEKMTAACQGIINESYERYVFNTRVQQRLLQRASDPNEALLVWRTESVTDT